MIIKKFQLGPTGRSPFGKAGADDEGEIQIALATDHAHGIVRLEFGSPVTWLGLPAKHARELAGFLIERADELDRQKA